MDARKQRIVDNEVLFRAANERMYSWPEERQKAIRGQLMDFWCECGVRGCRERVRLSPFTYEAVRLDPMLFVVLRDHVFPQAERIVEDHGGFVIVQKHEDARSIAERADPRDGTDAR